MEFMVVTVSWKKKKEFVEKYY